MMNCAAAIALMDKSQAVILFAAQAAEKNLLYINAVS